MVSYQLQQLIEQIHNMRLGTDGNFFFRTPADDKKVKHFEVEFGVRLPESYKYFLSHFNGGMYAPAYETKQLKTNVDLNLLKDEGVYLYSIEEIHEKYQNLKKQNWKIQPILSPYPVIPFCVQTGIDLLVFLTGNKIEKESPVFDAFHEDFPETWGISSINFENFLDLYLKAKGFPYLIGDETLGVASDYFNYNQQVEESAEQILSRTQIEIEENNEDDFAYYERSDVFYKKGQISEAFDMINKALEIKPKNAFYHFIKGEILRDGKQIRASLIEFDTAVQLEPNDTLYLCSRAGSLYQMARNEAALKDCNKAIEIDKQYLLAYLMRRDIYQLLGLNDLAAIDQQKIDELNKLQD
ncbi:MAG: SMI1/KNR4 family protein [Bacteroidales bacterium]|nr:SMI1/KNR4 family protein [Bacteroidales bacterium]